jgi:hypothetical protein
LNVKLIGTLTGRYIYDVTNVCICTHTHSVSDGSVYVLLCFRPEEKSDFDFMDEMSAPKFTPRRTGEGGPKGSAKKKTTSLDGILSNIRRHRKLEEMEKQASESAINNP